MPVTVTVVICLVLDLVTNVKKKPSHKWDLRTGSMLLTGKSGVLSKHDASCVHRKSVILWNQYKINSERSDRLGTCRSQQITQKFSDN